MNYTVKLITPSKKDFLIKNLKFKFERKAEIHGMCVELLTNNKEFKEMWEDNFDPMSNTVRPHCRILTLDDKKLKKNTVFYEPISKTVFLYNFDYYGWVKSIALAAASDFIEDYQSIHRRGYVHGACLDFMGKGIAIVGPPKTGKTTLSYGLLANIKNSKLVADDWFFVKITAIDCIAYMSERNSYIQKDLSENWPVFKPLVKETKFDFMQRGVANVAEIIGKDRIRHTTVLNHLFVLQRDKNEKRTFYHVEKNFALNYLIKNNFCNPHFLVKDRRKEKLRISFFKLLLNKIGVSFINTISTPNKTLEEVKKYLKKCNYF